MSVYWPQITYVMLSLLGLGILALGARQVRRRLCPHRETQMNWLANFALNLATALLLTALVAVVAAVFLGCMMFSAVWWGTPLYGLGIFLVIALVVGAAYDATKYQ